VRVERQSECGQAAVEAALTLPLTLFLILGTLQLSLLMQGRALAHYAAFKATRAGSVNQGDCRRMVDAAVFALLPSFTSFLSPSMPGNGAAEKLVEAWKQNRFNRYTRGGLDGPIVWLFREAPDAASVRALPLGQDAGFDTPGALMRLEVRLVYWMPLRIPFAGAVFSHLALAQWGLRDMRGVAPWMPSQSVRATDDDASRPEHLISQELTSRVSGGQYVFPVEATYTMRMMTPARASSFQTQGCGGLP
jgi:hypothetical protein